MADSTQQIWRIIDVLKWSKEYLKERQVESPQIEIEWILREVLNLSRLEIYLRHERPLSADELARIKALLLKRAAGQPIQYVLGSAEFMGLTFKVDPAVLIPRPETEILVGKVLEKCKARNWLAPRILDIGTGSGCIAIACAYFLPDCRVVAVDISSSALKIARENAALHSFNDRINFLEMDILKPDSGIPGDFQIIVSNPPYVAGEWFANLPVLVKEHEPEIALNPGDDDLLFYRCISKLAPVVGVSGGLVAMEIGGDYQAPAVIGLFSGDSYSSVEVIKDYAAHSRVVVAEIAA
ncbi:MAG: peptide chain release factor N(5)-glutamine methyltransferase [Candidatus Neomarinimicrobiota bacterium]